MAAVRGMGVAVITSTSGTRPASPAPFERSAARCSTPKRCCSSITTTPSEWNATPSWMRAWVPMTRSTLPSARPASTSRRSVPLTRLVSSATRSGRSPNRLPGSGTVTPSSSARTDAACCSASTSVGAIERALVAALHRRQQRRHGDDGLAGADVALQQPVHGVGPGQVGLDLGDRAPLGTGQRERAAARGTGATSSPPTYVAEAGRLLLQPPFAQDEDELHPQQLVEGEAAAGLLLLPHRVGRVDRRRTPGAGRPGRSGAAPRPAAGRGCPGRPSARSAWSTTPAISQVAMAAFSLCG